MTARRSEYFKQFSMNLSAHVTLEQSVHSDTAIAHHIDNSTNDENIIDNMVDKCYDSLEKPKPKFKVLNHGDLWVSNMMFKTEEEKVLDVLFVSI